MRFLPRYSLLTLLIVTALVAGGVMYWRGPHWRTLSTPVTAFEAALFDKHPEVPRFDLLYPVITDYQYRNTGDGPELHMIRGQPAPQTELSVIRWQPNSPDAETAADENAEDKQMDSGDAVIVPASMLDKNEPLLGKVRCWYAPSRWLYAGETTPHIAETNGIQLPPFWIFPRCYFVTDRGQVYKYAQSYLIICARLVAVAEIPEPEVRALIEQELERLPPNNELR